MLYDAAYFSAGGYGTIVRGQRVVMAQVCSLYESVVPVSPWADFQPQSLSSLDDNTAVNPVSLHAGHSCPRFQEFKFELEASWVPKLAGGFYRS